MSGILEFWPAFIMAGVSALLFWFAAWLRKQEPKMEEER